MCTAVGGALRGITQTDLVRQTVEALLARAGINPANVDRLLIQGGDPVRGHTVDSPPAGIPAIAAGNSQGAVHEAARAIFGGSPDVVVVVGADAADPHAIHSNGVSSAAWRTGPDTPADRDIQATLRREMAAELLCAKYAITRRALDEYAVRSHHRAAEVAASGEFDKEIAPLRSSGEGTPTGQLAVCDETIDRGATVEKFSAIRPTLADGVSTTHPPDIAWSITPRNTARPAVGAAAVLLMSNLRAAQLGLRPRARIRGFTVARGDIDLPLAAVLRATEKLLGGSKVSLKRIDHLEVDEEFACVPLAWCTEFSVSTDIFNPRGGALALGDARACTGLRQMTTMLAALEATGGRFGLQTLNADTGHGYATLIERC
jgi:acetyl-CoA acyltransferase